MKEKSFTKQNVKKLKKIIMKIKIKPKKNKD